MSAPSDGGVDGYQFWRNMALIWIWAVLLSISFALTDIKHSIAAYGCPTVQKDKP